MSRRLQHIAPTDEVVAAKREGRKAIALCGSRNYPMTEMGDHIPTCSRCSRLSMDDYERRLSEAEARAVDYRQPISITYAGNMAKRIWWWPR